MPWQETTPMRELVKFIGEWEAKMYGFGELCDRHGISRKTGYKWLGRYEKEGVGGLRVRSHAPLSCPHRMAEATSEAIVEVRRNHPRWGGRKILDYLRRRQPKLAAGAEFGRRAGERVCDAAPALRLKASGASACAADRAQ
jgi:hypothetical protein